MSTVPQYSVAALREQIARATEPWAGQTMVVRAIAEPCPWWGSEVRTKCAGRRLVLAGLPSEAPADPLPLVRLADNPLLTFLRDLPVFGAVVPRPPALPVLVPARFHVRLRALPPDSCAERLPCLEVLVLDIVPGSG